MTLFGPVHIALLMVIAGTAALLSLLARRRPQAGWLVALLLGCGLAVNEVIWWIFRYSH